MHGRQAVRWWDDAPQARRTAVAHPWWDDAPVPPPVVVASADGRTPAVTFAPDADPFSAGGLFAPAGGREGEPAVVVHPAPDAAVTRPARRGRAVVSAAGANVPTGPAAVDRGPDHPFDTGSLVRPYVPAVEAPEPGAPDVALPPALEPSVGADGPAKPLRRIRRDGGRLDRIIEIAPTSGPITPVPALPVGDWSAPWSLEAERPARSLFEPAAPRREPEGLWAAPREQPLPSRKALRAKERAATDVATTSGIAGRELSARTTGRRLAKSGVLAVTAMGVVAASAPNAFTAIGWRTPGQPTAGGAQAALVGLAAPQSLSAPSLGSPAASAAELTQALRDNAARRTADDAVAAARAGAAATDAGRSLVDVARQQVLAEAARKQAIAERASRNILRDPRSFARLLVQERGWSASQFTCLNLLWNRESGWNYRATNASSGAYGIPQALPGSKMNSIAPDWRTNPATQIKWGLNYIAERYGTPCGAWAHSEAVGWY